MSLINMVSSGTSTIPYLDVSNGNSLMMNKPGQIYAKMSAVMRDVGAIGKDQKNQAQGFKFRGIDQFVNALYPALTRHGVFLSPRSVNYTQELKEVTRSNGKAGVDKHVSLMMEYTFYAEDGSSVTIGPVPAEGLDSGDKATNKALSAALKYALIQTFSIPTEDMAEADLETPEIGLQSKSTTSTVPTTTTSTEAPREQSEAPVVASKKTSSFRKPTAAVAVSKEETGDWE
jgi:hypothetical protein